MVGDGRHNGGEINISMIVKDFLLRLLLSCLPSKIRRMNRNKFFEKLNTANHKSRYSNFNLHQNIQKPLSHPPETLKLTSKVPNFQSEFCLHSTLNYERQMKMKISPIIYIYTTQFPKTIFPSKQLNSAHPSSPITVKNRSAGGNKYRRREVEDVTRSNSSV